VISLSAAQIITLGIATGILVAGVADDLRSRKFHNWLFLVCAGIALITVLVTIGIGGFVPALLGFLCGAAVLLPFVLVRAIGAGDMKLLAAFGIVAGWPAALSVAVYALFWGALFGVARAVALHQGGVLAQNFAHILMFRRSQGLELQKFPYTVAIFFGWISFLAVGGII
jgi:Flp pilus assembly protein protease CpaA